MKPLERWLDQQKLTQILVNQDCSSACLFSFARTVSERRGRYVAGRLQLRRVQRNLLQQPVFAFLRNDVQRSCRVCISTAFFLQFKIDAFNNWISVVVSPFHQNQYYSYVPGKGPLDVKNCASMLGSDASDPGHQKRIVSPEWSARCSSRLVQGLLHGAGRPALRHRDGRQRDQGEAPPQPAVGRHTRRNHRLLHRAVARTSQEVRRPTLRLSARRGVSSRAQPEMPF